MPSYAYRMGGALHTHAHNPHRRTYEEAGVYIDIDPYDKSICADFLT